MGGEKYNKERVTSGSLNKNMTNSRSNATLEGELVSIGLLKKEEIERAKLIHEEEKKKRQEEKEEKRKREEAREIARKLAEEVRQKELEEEEAGRKSRELQRKQALEELQKIKRLSQIAKSDLESERYNGENIPEDQVESPDEMLYFRASDESRRRSRYAAMRHKDDQDSPRVKEMESIISAGKKARDEAAWTARKIEAEAQADRLPGQHGAAYYGQSSAVRRGSKEGGVETSAAEIDDDLADEVEAIRLAADFTSRRLLSEQRRESVAPPTSGSRLRIRALLDKQKNQREEEERERNKKRESQDITKFLWVYR